MALPPTTESSEYATWLVQQQSERLEKLTELSLSGHWQQLSSLGRALHTCQSLTCLDLSRNGLVSLQGLQTLHALRQLNVYYNVIGRLAEIDRLRQHPALEVLDMRALLSHKL